MSYTEIYSVLKLRSSSVRRWQSRIRQQRPAIHTPGVKKVVPLDQHALETGMLALEHGQRRTRGVARLYERFKWSLSRRDMQSLVAGARRDEIRRKRETMHRIDWVVPNLAWAMDDLEYGLNEDGQKQYLHTMQDLATAYKFEPLAGRFPNGDMIAGHILMNFEAHGFPLFVKEDNGSNQIAKAVRDVLESHCVLLLTSYPEYPQYNGAEEHGNGEVRRRMSEQLAPSGACPENALKPWADSAVHHLNHVRRDKLKGGNACVAYHCRGYKSFFDIRERRSIYEWLIDKQNDILLEVKTLDGTVSDKAAANAWRQAAMIWLWMNEFVKVSLNGKVLPYSLWKNAHK